MQIPIIRRGGASLTGSSSACLNFKIVGGTEQPANPKENTIWVNTDQTIGEWTFSIDQPSSAQTGDIWISTQNSSAIAFDALAENTLMIYPLDAYQYLNNAWVKKPMAIYKNGEWETGDLVLYDGVEWNSDYSYTLNQLTLTKNDGYLSLTRKDGGNGYFDIIIDLTGYDSIEIDAQGAICYGSMWYSVMKNGEELVAQGHNSDNDGNDLATRKQFSIPISNLSGSHTFRYSMWSSNGFTSKLYSLVLKKS